MMDIGKDNRSEPRLHVRWHAEAIIDGVGTFSGFVKDISSKGTDIFLDCNLQKVKQLRLQIHVPPPTKASQPHVMEVSARVVYTAYDSTESMFHTGVSFLRFCSENDLSYLQSRIAAFNRG